MKEIVNLKASLMEEFSVKDLDPMRKILEISINRERKEVVDSITDRVREEGAEEVYMADAKPMNVPP